MLQDAKINVDEMGFFLKLISISALFVKIKAPWPGFEPGSRYTASSHVESGGLTAPGTFFAKARQPPILDRTILPGHLKRQVS